MPDNGQTFGAFLPTTNVWDVNELYDIDVQSPEFKELLVRLYQNINNIAIMVNLKDTGYYTQQEFVCGQLFFSNPALNSLSTTSPQDRQVYRKTINFGALPNTTSKSVAHGIIVNGGTSWTRIYGAATNPTAPSGIPLPYASPTLANNIEVSVTSTNVVVTTGSNRTAFTTCYIVLEYLQN